MRLAQAVLPVGRSLVGWSDDGASRGIGFLSGVNANRTEACAVVEFHWRWPDEECAFVRMVPLDVVRPSGRANHTLISFSRAIAARDGTTRATDGAPCVHA